MLGLKLTTQKWFQEAAIFLINKNFKQRIVLTLFSNSDKFNIVEV